MAQTTPKKYVVGFQHVALAATMIISFFVVCFWYVLPWGVSAFVVPLFQPSGEKLEKVGFVQFEGLVWASTQKDKEQQLAGQNIPIKREYINREFIFDFSFIERDIEHHGYVKGKWEWYAKAETLGEHAIILEPWVGFWFLAFVIALVLTIFITMFLPDSLGIMAILFNRQIDNTRIKIRLQTGFSDDIVRILISPDSKLADMDHDEVERAFRFVWERTVTEGLSSTKQSIRFDEVFDDDIDVVTFRNEAVYERIKEYFSDFVVSEIEDCKDGLMWRANHLMIMKGLRIYMAHHFTEKYSNNVTGLAYGGAAFLIVAVGVRGLKFIPAAKPSFILLAITLEFTMLMLMATTLFYTEEAERLDKMLKKMEDANKSQLETLRGQQYDIHQLTNALVGQTADIIKQRVEKAITEYMTSGDNMQNAIAEEIGNKIMQGIRDTYIEGGKK